MAKKLKTKAADIRKLNDADLPKELEEAYQGGRMRIVEARPMSRRKRWQVVEVLTRAELPEVAAESIDLELLGEIKPVLSEAEGPVLSEAEGPVLSEAEP